MSESETSYQSVLTSAIASGVSSETLYHDMVPAAARRLGEMWVTDHASFVAVTIGAARLQSVFQEAASRGETGRTVRLIDRTVPLGQSVLMILPEGEDHTLGAFVAADQFRRHGLWVRIAVQMSQDELVEVIGEGHFAMVGVSISREKAVENVAGLINYLKMELEHCPPVVLGGRYVPLSEDISERTGADHAVRSAREAIELCGLASVADFLSSDATTS
ncbi:B12-binding domain-containing protein [Lutimaribacter marinistellae]|uniref:B12-binding domain-containing protein n=1 Tax=Lutimaribacter marinistellae TaxID=1820329 RepID=A0ABV7TFV7_9RHOB